MMDVINITYKIDTDYLSIGDKRVLNFPFMRNPLPLLAVIGLYFMIVYKWGPSYMQNRKPYNLKWILAAYNLIQIAACCHLIVSIISSDFTHVTFWKCQSVDYRNSPKAVYTLKLTYFTFLIKLVELIETVFFVLRKKQNQISKLHVYHHTSTVLLAWIMVKYSGGGMIMFSIALNSIVHVIMYGYYFAALFGPVVQKKLEGIKRNITLIQMIQFTIILTQCGIGLAKNCDVPKLLLAIYAPNVAIIFYMFYGFFRKAYSGKCAKDKR